MIKACFSKIDNDQDVTDSRRVAAGEGENRMMECAVLRFRVYGSLADEMPEKITSLLNHKYQLSNKPKNVII